MKKKYLCIIIFVFIAGIYFSCKKDAPLLESMQVPSNPAVPQPTETLYNYFVNYDADFVNGYMPEYQYSHTGCPEIIAISGNSYVIPGGSNNLDVNFFDTDNDVTELYYGVVGVYGYYKINMPPGNSNHFTFVIILSQLIKKNNFIIEVCLKDAKNNISKPYFIPVELRSAQPGKLQVSLSFDQSNDIDLHVIEPDSTEISYQNPQSPSGGFLDLDANAGCVYDSVNNENIIYNDSIPLGVYKVRVAYYMQCISGVNTNFSVSALYNGELIMPDSGTNPYVGNFPDGAVGSSINIMTFEIDSVFKKIAHFQFIKKKVIKYDPAKFKNKTSD